MKLFCKGENLIWCSSCIFSNITLSIECGSKILACINTSSLWQSLLREGIFFVLDEMTLKISLINKPGTKYWPVVIDTRHLSRVSDQGRNYEHDFTEDMPCSQIRNVSGNSIFPRPARPEKYLNHKWDSWLIFILHYNIIFCYFPFNHEKN